MQAYWIKSMYVSTEREKLYQNFTIHKMISLEILRTAHNYEELFTIGRWLSNICLWLQDLNDLKEGNLQWLTGSFLVSLSRSMRVTLSLTLRDNDRAISPAVLMSFSRRSRRRRWALSATYSASATAPKQTAKDKTPKLSYFK